MLTRLRARGGALGGLASLFGAQGLGFAVTVIQVPYLTRALLPAGYGVYAFCNVLILVATNVIGYASNNTGVVRFQRHRASPVRRSFVFWDQFGVQLTLALVCSAAILAMALTSRTSDGEAYALLLLIPFCLSNAVYCPWVLSALGRFQRLSSYTMALRVGSLVLVLLLVHGPADIWIAVLTVVLPNIAITVAFALSMWRGGILVWIPPRRWRVGAVFRRDLYIALSTYIIVVQANLPVMAAKLILPPVDYGLLAFADRFRTISQMVVGTFGLVLFTRFAASRGPDGAIPPQMARRSILVFLAVGMMTGGSIVLFCPWVIAFLGGARFADAYWPTILIGASVPVAALNYYLTFFVIALFGLARQQAVNLLAVAILSAVALTTPYVAHAWAVATLVLMIEIARATAALMLLRRHGISFLAPARATR